MFLCPVDGESTAVGEDHYDGLASRCDGFKQILLGLGQVDAGAVATMEAGLVDGHLFALKLAGDADDGNDGIGFFCSFDGRRIDRAIDLCPHHAQMRIGRAGGRVLHRQMVGFARFKVNAAGERLNAVRIVGRGNNFAVERDMNESVGFDAEFVVAGFLRRERRLAAHGEGLDRGDFGGRRLGGHVD